MSERFFKSSEFLSEQLEWYIEELDRGDVGEADPEIEKFQRIIGLATSSLVS